LWRIHTPYEFVSGNPKVFGVPTNRSLADIRFRHGAHRCKRHDLARVYMEQERYKEAESLFKKVLEVRDAGGSFEEAQRADSLHYLASVYVKQNRSGQAEPLYRRALEIRDRVLGPKAEQTLITAYNLAQVCAEQGNYDEAEKLFRRVAENGAINPTDTEASDR
jgi:tetratricopeptide (TPR) repeat protein